MKNISIKQLQDWDAFIHQDGPLLSTALMESILSSLHIPYTLLTRSIVAGLLKPRKPFSHKGTYGHALLMAGNTGKMGAALLAAKACLRSGAGLLTLAIPENTAAIVFTALPEAMVLNRNQETILWKDYQAIGAGPGLGTDEVSGRLMEQLLQQAQRPLVLDADALNWLSVQQGWSKLVPANTILTPHPKEFDRLFGNSTNEFERWQKALDASLQYGWVIVVKGHYTLIAAKGKAWFNTNTNAGLAKGGTGDCLTGMITAFAAQGYTAEQAAILGVYVHGQAANCALRFQSVESLLASDVIAAIGEAFEQLHAK